MASSSARKPIAHHGQTISETKSMRIGVVMALLGGRWCCDRGGVVEFRAACQCGLAIPGYDAPGCARDWKSLGLGKSVSVRFYIGGRSINNKYNQDNLHSHTLLNELQREKSRLIRVMR